MEAGTLVDGALLEQLRLRIHRAFLRTSHNRDLKKKRKLKSIYISDCPKTFFLQPDLSGVAALELALLADGLLGEEDYGVQEHGREDPQGEHLPDFARSL